MVITVNFIRENSELFNIGLQKRGLQIAASNVLELDDRCKQIQNKLQEMQTKRNNIAKEIGKCKNIPDSLNKIEFLKQEAEQVRTQISALEQEHNSHKAELQALLVTLPNIPASDVPYGHDETANLELKTWGKIPEFPYIPRAHYELGEALGQMDFARAAEICGSRFVILQGELARLERALGNYMLDQHVAHGFSEVNTPVLVRDHHDEQQVNPLEGNPMYNAGQLPKFDQDSFKVAGGYRLIPTSEVTLVNLVAGKLFQPEELPLRYTALTNCFRSEAGSAGRDTRGMIRLHQFSKVELVSITSPEQSAAEHEFMLHRAESILVALGLPYRVMLLCSQDMGFAAAKTYDLEVWLPAQNKYREISSCSNCLDFQAARMQTRVRAGELNGGGKNRLVHTLNGSGLAVGRTLLAIMENYQQQDGSIIIPDVLRPYMGGLRKIEAR